MNITNHFLLVISFIVRVYIAVSKASPYDASITTAILIVS